MAYKWGLYWLLTSPGMILQVVSHSVRHLEAVPPCAWGNAVTWTAAVGGSSEDWPRAVQMLREMQQYHGVFPWAFWQSQTLNVLPWNLTWNLKMEVSKMIFLFSWVLFRFHVEFQGCMVYLPTVPHTLSVWACVTVSYRLPKKGGEGRIKGMVTGFIF